jgi:hypothetical protein
MNGRKMAASAGKVGDISDKVFLKTKYSPSRFHPAPPGVAPTLVELGVWVEA